MNDKQAFSELNGIARMLTGAINNPDYRFWVVVDGKIESGWEYPEDAKDQLGELPAGKTGKVLMMPGLRKLGLDPNDDMAWTTGRIAANDGKVYGIDMRVIRQHDSTGGHWTKVVRDTLKYGDGKVKIVKDLGDRVEVVADAPMGGVIGPVTIPRAALIDVPIKQAAARTANSSLLESVISQQDLLKVQDHVDEQTWRLAIEVFQKLQQDFMLTDDQQEAINRLKQSIKGAGSWSQDLQRNNIFKAAHALGIALPSGMF